MRYVASTILKQVFSTSSRLMKGTRFKTSKPTGTVQGKEQVEQNGKKTLKEMAMEAWGKRDKAIELVFEVGCSVSALVYVAVSQKEIQKAIKDGNQIIIGNHQETKEKVLQYFKSENLPNNNLNYNTISKVCYGYFKLRITSINGFKDEWIDFTPLDNTFLLICHSSKDKFTDVDRNWIADFDRRIKTSLPMYRCLVLSDCLSPSKDFYYRKLGINKEDENTFKENPILLKPNGNAFGFTLFLLHFPSCLWKDVLIIPFVIRNAPKFLRLIRQLLKKRKNNIDANRKDKHRCK